MALRICSYVALVALLISLSICSAHRVHSLTFPNNMPEDKIASEPDPEIPDDISDTTKAFGCGGGGGMEGDSKWNRGGGGGGGWGRGGGYTGAGGYGRAGGGWSSGGDPIPRMPPTGGEPFYCRQINCGDPYACPGFTLYLNHPAAASDVSKDVVRGEKRHQTGGVV